MRFEFDAVAISVNSRLSKDGKTYYSLNIDQDGEVMTLDCAEDVALGIQKYKPYHFAGSYVKGEFNGRTYSRIGVTSVEQSPK